MLQLIIIHKDSIIDNSHLVIVAVASVSSRVVVLMAVLVILNRTNVGCYPSQVYSCTMFDSTISLLIYETFVTWD